MGNQIKDGSGQGYLARVNSQQKLLTEATVFTNMHTISNNFGQAYVLTTDFISITTTASYSGILYVQNTSAELHMHIALIKAAQDVLTQWKFIKNPTTGTLISTATVGTATNLNFNSNNNAAAIVYKGADALTVTDGSEAAFWTENAGGIPIGLDGAVILQTNDTVAFMAQPTATANIAMSLMVYFDEDF